MKTLTLGIVLLAVGGCKMADKVTDDLRMQLGEVKAELRTAVDAVQEVGERGTAQAGGFNYNSAFGFGSALVMMFAYAALAFLMYKVAEWSHLRELERIKHRNGSDKA